MLPGPWAGQFRVWAQVGLGLCPDGCKHASMRRGAGGCVLLHAT